MLFCEENVYIQTRSALFKKILIGDTVAGVNKALVYLYYLCAHISPKNIRLTRNRQLRKEKPKRKKKRKMEKCSRNDGDEEVKDWRDHTRCKNQQKNNERRRRYQKEINDKQEKISSVCFFLSLFGSSLFYVCNFFILVTIFFAGLFSTVAWEKSSQLIKDHLSIRNLRTRKASEINVVATPDGVFLMKRVEIWWKWFFILLVNDSKSRVGLAAVVASLTLVTYIFS